MKNKEIEEILNYMKQYVENIYEHDSEPMLNYKDLQIVLSYVEQLENNRDKALKIIESYELGKYDYSIPPGGIIELRDVLRGDSDE